MSTGRPQISSREALVEAGLELIDEQGLAALNMRNLAARVGISAMTPYTYFASKAEFRDALIEHALAALSRGPAPGERWDRALETAMRGLHDALRRHPGIVDLLGDRSTRTVLAEQRRDLIELLESAGLSAADATDALRTLTSYVVGYVLLTRDAQGPASFDRGLHMLLAQIRAEAP